MSKFSPTFSYKLIYVFRVNDEIHKGLLKIGDATIDTDKPITELISNCRELNQSAKERISSYTKTLSTPYDLLHTELAIKEVNKAGRKRTVAFRDKDVHKVLERSGKARHKFDFENQGVEWFKIDLETAKNAIKAVKNNQSSLSPNEITENLSPIIFRPEQQKAIKETIRQFKTGDRMLWNAKMRFGKTLTALEVAKEMNFKKVLIFTHRPVVSEGWFDDFNKIFYDTNYKFGSKTKGEKIEKLVDGNAPFVYFASIQDLRGSQAVGGKFDKNEFIFLIDWDMLIVDEAHEGTQTTLGQKVLETILSNDPNKLPKLLELSGTPFNLLNQYKKGEIYTWDYIMEQRAKENWAKEHFGDSNPYEELPKLEIFTYNLDKFLPSYIDVADGAFNFKEFFRTWTGNVQKDFKRMPEGARVGDFIHEKDILAFLNLITKSSKDDNFPFSSEEYRSYYKHTLWMLPGVKEAKALSKMLKSHPIFGQFKIVNVAGEGDEEREYKDALEAVQNAIGDNPDDHYTITLSCGRLTTGVTVPEWTAVLMLAGSFNTSASSYLQTIFRVQTPANINGRIKQRCSVFDFAPDRTLKMVAEAGQLNPQIGRVSDKVVMGEFLNYCPVISLDDSNMVKFDVNSMLQQLKRAYTDKVVKNGFDDKNIYNNNLLKLDDIEIKDFEELKAIIGASKQTKKTDDLDVNRQGFTDEEYEELERIERKPKQERTPEELAFLEEKKKNRDNAQKARSILRGISIRIPLLIYGADVKDDEEITRDNFVDIIDDVSWEEFMPKGVTKDIYRKFKKYYEEDVFIGAGRRIRNIAKSADELTPTERVIKIADLFSTFKNPDKETVLTPWRVVNMHMGDTLGGYDFFNEDHSEVLEEPRFRDNGQVAKDTLANVDAKILEINSKTGLYPLYVTYSIYRKKLDEIPENERTAEKQFELWKDTVEKNVFIICKTPMAKSITKRTLLGYRKGKINAHAFDDLIMQIKNKPEQFRDKILKGSTWNKQEEVMKFDAIVGNPPYQINDGSGASDDSANPIYNNFVENGIMLTDKYLSMIMPAKWMVGGKPVLKKFRQMMTDTRHLKSFFDFEDSKECFPSQHLDGGICYFLYDKNYNGDISYTYKPVGEDKFTKQRLLKYENQTTIIRDARKFGLIYKVDNEIKFSSIVSLTQPFGIRKDVFNNPEKYTQYKLNDNYFDGSVKLYGVKGIKGGAKRKIGYLSKSAVTKNIDAVNKYKIFFTTSYSTNALIPPEVILSDPNEICTETFLMIGPFNSKEEMENCNKYIHTKFFRILLYLGKGTMQVNKDVFSLIPIQNFTSKSDIDWSKNIDEINSQLYKKYTLLDAEIQFIDDKFDRVL